MWSDTYSLWWLPFHLHILKRLYVVQSLYQNSFFAISNRELWQINLLCSLFLKLHIHLSHNSFLLLYMTLSLFSFSKELINIQHIRIWNDENLQCYLDFVNAIWFLEWTQGKFHFSFFSELLLSNILYLCVLVKSPKNHHLL